jgi:hypothetical protein
MRKPIVRRKDLDPLLSTFAFMKRHWTTLFCLGLVAGIGRVAQLGGFGEVSPFKHGLLEVLVEGSRVAILLFVVGIANVRRGFRHVVRLLSGKVAIGKIARTAWSGMRLRWIAFSLSFIAFILIAGVINVLIDQLAYETCLYLTLKREGILAGGASEWTILLFFKNISVIPFTLVFETCLLLWLANKWPGQLQHTESLVS